MPEETPQTTFWNGTKLKVWTIGQVTHCLRSGIAGVAEEWIPGRGGRAGV